MKVNARSIVLLATAGLLLLLGSSSQSQTKGPLRKNWSDVHRALDKNQDGKVTAAELSDLKAAAELILKICNLDGDTGLSSDELIEVREIAFKADTDRNGYVDRQELDSWLVRWRTELSKTTADQTGQVAQESAPITKGRISLKTVLDTNRNGFNDFDIANVSRAARTIMKRFDLNGDKRLSAVELYPIEESLRDEDADGEGVTAKELTDWLVDWRRQLAAAAQTTPEPTKDPKNPKDPKDPQGTEISLAVLLDRNKNGLTAFDLANAPRSAALVMKSVDLNQNSVLDTAELALVVEPLYRADLDDNGVNLRELTDWLVAWRKELD